MMVSKTLTPFDYFAYFLAALLFVATFLSSRRKQRLPSPPGPPRLPVLGNLLDLPHLAAWEKYRDMSRKHGDLTSLTIPGHTIIVINSLKVAKELLDKRAQTWSDRPRIPLIHLMELDEWNMSLMSFSETHRTQRRIASTVLRPNSLTQHAYRSTQTHRVQEMLKSLLHQPDKFVAHVDYMLTGIILSMAYGYDLKTHDDPFLVKSRIMNHIFLRSMSPSASIVNVFPFLSLLPAWFPGMGRARDVPTVKELGRNIRDEPFERVIQEISDETAKPSLAQAYLFSRGFPEDPIGKALPAEEREYIVSVAAILYQGAVETTSTVLTNLFLLPLLHPQIQQRAQVEIDAVVGRERLPDIEDIASLPYVQAICLELLRWRMISPMGIPHATSADDVYEGYFIPKGSTIITNTWTILNDPEKYPNPEDFLPERFIGTDGLFVNDPDIMTIFGYGRRICPGRFQAMEVIKIVVLSVLSVFTVAKAKDEQGNEIPVEGGYTLDSPTHRAPLPFKCAIIPRDEKARALVEALLVTASETLGCDDV